MKGVAGVAVGVGISGGEGATPVLKSATPLLSPHWEGMTREEWEKRGREELRGVIEKYIGSPTDLKRVEARARVVEEVKGEEYRQLKVAYEVEEGQEVRAWLLVPAEEKRTRVKGAGALCLHGTSAEAKDTQVGAGAKRGRDYGRQLARAGFVTLSPDHCCSGERLVKGYKAYDSKPFYARHPDWSMVGKAIWDGQRALDVLAKVEEVDATRMGVVGHSLGGQGAVFVAAFDGRVRAAVSSCGIATWSGNPNLPQWSRDEWYVYFPHLRKFTRGEGKMPFDLYEFAGLMAPRAFLNISGMTDPTYGPTDRMWEMEVNLHKLYRLVGRPDGFASLMMGGGHDVPGYSQALTQGWLEVWLCA